MTTDQRLSMMSPAMRMAAPAMAPVAAAVLACEAAGHALGQPEHNADRWIAATAIRHDIPLVSNDRIFRVVPGLVLETADAP